MTCSRVLREAVVRIEAPGAFSDKPYTVNKYDRPCHPCSRGAAKWDVLGAITRAASDIGLEIAAMYALRRHLGVDALAVWNSQPRTQADAVEALRGAAQAAEAREGVTKC